ncbi:ATP-dependent DNA helicase pif1, partial [Rhynchospora pubera]
IYTVEFQKRGIPHVHIVVWLADRTALSDPAAIDSVISAELPNPVTDPEGYAVVSRFMLHGPCGASRPMSPCMKDGKCKKYFPKEFSESTVITHDEFVRYRRRNLGITAEKNGCLLDNRHVVPHNIKMLIKCDAHINVERCHSSSTIKYLFKYILKGHDRAIVTVEHASASTSAAPAQQQTAQTATDEIRQYLDCRYLTPHESIWLVFSYDIHYSYPSVERLLVHLASQNNVVFRDFQELGEIAESDSFGFTKLMAWFELNKTDELARLLTYIEIPTKFTWKQNEKKWARRIQNRKRLARMLFVHPNAGELYYLRMLLNIVCGPTSFEDIRTVDGIVYPIFKEACDALGLLENDNEWLYTLQEAAGTASSQQVRKLFVDILLFSEVTNILFLWDACWRLMGDDILYNIRHQCRVPQFNCSDVMLKDHILYELEDMLISRGHSLQSVKLPQPTEERIYQESNTLLAQQLSYNTVELREQVPILISGLNHEQKNIMDKILISVQNKQAKQFFIYGPGGTGKTYLWTALTAKLRSEGKIVLTVASSGLSSLLLQGGVTAYSQFKIPIELNERSTCDIKKNSQLARLILSSSLIIWDEAPMSNKHCFEALDRTMRDLFASRDTALGHVPFGGMTVVLGGDFRQTLPVVTHGSRYKTIAASIVHSYLWDRFTVLHLTQNMRLIQSRDNPAEAERIAQFATWLLVVGNGQVPALALDGAAQAEWIQIPDKFLIRHDGDEQQVIIATIYGRLPASQLYDDYLRERAILTPKNCFVDSLNEKILSQLPGQLFRYYSADTAADKDPIHSQLRGTYPDEYLHNVNAGGLPPHCLDIKIGVPVMLLRNIDQPNGLCNGTRMVVTQASTRFIKARVITGSARGQEVYIPRIVFIHKDNSLPFNLRRKQFPICVCYAMTINKSQGQSLDK